MKRNLSIIAVIGLISVITSAGMSILIMQKGIGCRKWVIKTETRKTNWLSRKDIQMAFNLTGSELNFRLHYLPYFKIEQRDVIEYAFNDDKLWNSFLGKLLKVLGAILFLIVGQGVVGLILVWLPVTVISKIKGDFDPEDDFYGLLYFIIPTIIVVTNIVVVGIILSRDTVIHTSWRSSGKNVQGKLQWMSKQPYRVDLPEYGSSKTYRTQSGNEKIDLFEFATNMPKPQRFMNVRSIGVRASTKIDGKNYQEIIKITDQKALRAFHNAALASTGVDMVSTGKPRLMPRAEASAKWVKGEVQAGKSAILKVTVKNTGKGKLYRFTAKTASSYKAFDNRNLEFGKIEQGESKVLDLPLKTDKLMRTQDIPIRLSFEEYNDYAPPNIEAKLHIAKKPRPKFNYAYRIIDGRTPNSVGNGDGIIQRGESFDIVLTTRNSGKGTAEEVTTRLLNLSSVSGVKMFSHSSVEMGNIAAGDSKIATFNVGIKPNASVKSLSLELLVTERQFGNETKLIDSIKLPIDRKVAPKIVVVHLDGTITANSAEVHSGADFRTPIIAQIPQKSHVKITGQLGDWSRIEMDKELTGWLHAKSVTTQKITASSAASSQIAKPTIIRVFQRMPPQLTLIAPERNQLVVNTAAINLIVVATDDKGIAKIKLTVNGKPIEGRAVSVQPRKSDTSLTSITIKKAIPLSHGENQIKLIAFDTDNQRSEPLVLNATRTREMGELWVLSIGVSDYQHIRKLDYADDDAKAVADYFRNIGVPSDRVTLLLDRQATVGAIRRAFGELMGKAKEAASIVIYFSGHGAPTPNQSSPDGDGIDKYLLTHEAALDNLYGTALPMDEVAGVFKRLASERVIFIADTCYSGATGGKTVVAKKMTGNRATLDYERFLSRLAEGKGRIILTASRGNELSRESPKLKHGVFTYVLLEALRGSADRNDDGFITIAEVYDYVVHKVPKYANQHPMWKGEASGDLVIGRVK